MTYDLPSYGPTDTDPPEPQDPDIARLIELGVIDADSASQLATKMHLVPLMRQLADWADARFVHKPDSTDQAIDYFNLRG